MGLDLAQIAARVDDGRRYCLRFCFSTRLGDVTIANCTPAGKSKLLLINGLAEWDPSNSRGQGLVRR